MSTPLKVSTKLLILVGLAVVFGATLVALSVRDPHRTSERGSFWSESRDKDSRKVEKTFPVEAGGNLRVDADGANISVRGTAANEVNIVVSIHGSSSKVRDYRVDFSQDGNTVRIDGEQEKDFFQFNFFDGSFDVRYEIEVPERFNLDLNTSGGNLDVGNIAGTIKGETSGGEIDAEKLDGNVHLSTSGGNVGLKSSKGELTLRTSGGNIEGENLNGPLDVETSGGNIRLTNADGTLRASTSGGNIHVSVDDNKGMELETSGGNVSVRIPGSTSATVDAEATGGEVDCDLEFSGKIKDGTMRGKINGGGNMMRLRSSGGNIVISSHE